MVTPEQPPSSEPILEWARRNLGEPWEKLAAVSRRLSNGETLGPAEATLKLPGAPFSADWRVVFPLLKDAMSLLIFEPADLCILVLDPSRQTLIRAFHSRTRDNNFIDLTEIEIQESWSKPALALLDSDSVSRLRTLLDRYLQETSKRRVSWVAVVDLRFLERLRNAEAAAGAKPSLSDWLYQQYLALQDCLAEGSILVTPLPNLVARVFEWCRMTRYRREHYQGQPEARSNYRPVLWIRGAHYTVGFDLAAKDCEPLTLPQEMGNSLQTVPFPKLAAVGAWVAKADLSLALNADLGLNLLYEILSRPTPLEPHDSRIILEKVFDLIRRFQDQWDVHPRPIPLTTLARLPALLFGLPYDIRNLASGFLPGLMVDGVRYLLGDSYTIGLYALEGGRLAGITLFKIRRNAIAGIESLPAQEYQEVFAHAPKSAAAVREAVIQLRQRIWERWGWVDYQAAYARELGPELSRLVRSGAPFSFFRLLWQGPTLRRLGGILRKGGLVVYPVAMLEEGARWSARQPLAERLKMLSVPFERGRQTRGLLYVRETIIGLIGLLGLALLLGWWLS